MADITFDAGILLEASGLRVGENKLIDCPSCGRTKKMSVGKKPSGVVYMCFSTNCGEKGFVSDKGSYKVEVSRKPGVERKRFSKQISAPTPDDISFFKLAFGLTEATVKRYIRVCESSGEFVFPICGRTSLRSGEVVRQPKWSAGISAAHRAGREGAPKTLTYNVGSRLAWYTPDDGSTLTAKGEFVYADQSIVLVEDQISAMKIMQETGLVAVSLLGNTLGAEEWAEIAATKASTVIWWLDADVLQNTYLLNSTYGATMDFSKVVVTNLDPKSCSSEEILQVLGD